MQNNSTILSKSEPKIEATIDSNIGSSEEKFVYTEEKDAESDILDDDEEAKENFDNFNGTGRTVTLQMLMGANVLQPGKSLMTIEYLGQKFIGDLLPDGKIKSQETETIFLTPSAWAMHCKRIINPEKKSGCGWASVKYKGKKLDVYKNSWLRKCALQKESTPEDFENGMGQKLDSPEPVLKRNVFQHNVIFNRNNMHDANMLIEAVPFSAIGKLQPFLLTIKSSALLLADFHSHLTLNEVCGYLGGTWDINTCTLSITKVYPCRNIRLGNSQAKQIEYEIQKAMVRDQTIPVGWYHSHPKFSAEPSLRDCDSQLDYQMRMRGFNEMAYTPCIALIISPYCDENPSLESVIKSIWIIPPSENKQSLEYGRPMLMQFAVLQDKTLPDNIRTEIRLLVDYYSQFRNEMTNFNNIFQDDITFIEKLKNSLYPKFPINQKDKVIWNWICEILDCDIEDEFVPPKTCKNLNAQDNEKKNFAELSSSHDLNEDVFENKDITDEDKTQTDKKAYEIKVLSLQEQLCLPSGLNMNPVRMLSPLATPNPIGHSTPVVSNLASGVPNTTLTQNVFVTSTEISQPTQSLLKNTFPNISRPSPDNSPTILASNPISPQKNDFPVRASPSPAKSETSSHTSRPQNSPAASPVKFSVCDISHSSPSITPNKFEGATTLVSPSCLSAANELMAASLAQFAGQLPQNMLQADISTLFQQQRKDFGNSSLNQLAAAAAKAGGSKESQAGGVNDNGNKPDMNVAVTATTYSNNLNSSRAQNTVPQPLLSKSKSERFPKSTISFPSASLNSYKTKLMKDLDELKNDPLKMSELMRSPEYAALVLQQAEALGASTLGALGFGNDFNYLCLPNSSVNTSLNNNKTKLNSSAALTTAISNDYNNILQASKILGYESYLQQSKNTEINSYLQQQMGLSKKMQKPIQSHSDYTSLLQTYSKLFDTSNQCDTTLLSEKIGSANHNEFSNILSTDSVNEPSLPSSSKQKQKDVHKQIQQQNEMLHQLLQSEKQQSDLNSLLYQQNKAAAELNALFSTPNIASSLTSTVKSINSSDTQPQLTDTAAFYNAFTQEKLQDYTNFFQQHHGKYNIPDPLSKSTLAANNLFMSPSALVKIQQDSLSTIMMKPPKPSSITNYGQSSSPSLECITSTKTNNIGGGCKYNFNAVDLAISSISSNAGSPALSDNSNSSANKRLVSTPPVDLSRFYSELVPPSFPPVSTKKRMEYSSIADLAAPPPTKIQKNNDTILNLSE